MAPPRKPQLFAQRLLLLHVRGPQGFRELRTVDGREYPICCVDDAESKTHEKLLVQVLVFGRPQAPLDLWEEFSDTMYDTRGTRDNEALRLRRQRVRAAQLIIMDEMSMARRDLFDAVENICV
uniref:DNA helicase n=1 Tax=Ditylenchus dipsaci TaxID=166011 RepID=A0A915CTF6_9BILA